MRVSVVLAAAAALLTSHVAVAISCLPGQTPSGIGAGSTCKPCTGANQFSKGGHGRCLTCKPGYEANAEHSDCVPISCPAGQGIRGHSQRCQPCRSGKFSAGGTFARCEFCPPFQNVNANQSGCEAKTCPPGTALEPSGRCHACIGRTVSPGGTHHTCDECPPFTYPSNNAVCSSHSCPPGQRIDRDGVCVECGDHSVSPGGNSRECTRCERPYVPSQPDKSHCVLGASQNAHHNRREAALRRERERNLVF